MVDSLINADHDCHLHLIISVSKNVITAGNDHSYAYRTRVTIL